MNEEKGQTLVEHLVELRFRLIRAIWGLIIGFSICWNFSEQLMDIIRRPIAPYLGQATQGGLVFLGVMDKFMAHLKVSFLGGVILSCPFWLYQAWKFVAPGLYDKEKRYAVSFIGCGSILFLVGVAFAYFLVFPTAFEYLLGFGGSVDRPMITLDEYLSFFVTTTLVFGAAFELPLIIVVLGMFGLVDHQILRKNRRYAVVILAVVAAILTPPDVLSMCTLMFPLFLLYEVSIWIVKAMGNSKPKAVS